MQGKKPRLRLRKKGEGGKETHLPPASGRRGSQTHTCQPNPEPLAASKPHSAEQEEEDFMEKVLMLGGGGGQVRARDPELHTCTQ